MTKQEEIRKGIGEIILATYHAGSLGTSISDVLEVSTQGLLRKLNSQGVVIVDKERINLTSEALMARVLPDIFDGSLSPFEYGREQDKYLAFVKLLQEELQEKGYVAVEPLIKEKLNG